MNKNSLIKKIWKEWNITIDVDCAEDLNDFLEILGYVEFVSENMLESERLWGLEKPVGNKKN